jgi:hypothetical protein
MNQVTENSTPIEVGNLSESFSNLLRATQSTCQVLKEKALAFIKKLEDAATEARRIDHKIRSAREKDHSQLSLFPREL